MASPGFPVGFPNFGSISTGVLLFLGACVTAGLSYLGVQSTRTAPLQEALNGAFTSLMDELQTDRARLLARILELEAQNTELHDDVKTREGEIQRLRGEIRGNQQREDSLRRWAERSGVTLPPIEKQGSS